VLGATLPTEEYLYSPGPTRFSMLEREEIRAGLTLRRPPPPSQLVWGGRPRPSPKEVKKNDRRSHYRA